MKYCHVTEKKYECSIYLPKKLFVQFLWKKHIHRLYKYHVDRKIRYHVKVAIAVHLPEALDAGEHVARAPVAPTGRTCARRRPRSASTPATIEHVRKIQGNIILLLFHTVLVLKHKVIERKTGKDKQISVSILLP